MPPKAMKKNPLPKGKANVMKVMKSMKAKPLPKGSKNMTGKGTGSSTDKKHLAKRGQRTMKLKRANLAKLGKLTLAEKVQKASENAENPDEAAANLRDMMNKSDHSKAWSKHNIHMKSKTAKEKKDFDKKSKGEKGQEVALYLVRTNVPRFMHWKESLSHVQTLAKREQWKSEVELVAQFGKDEFDAHVASGRIEWREDPFTWGVFNYRDKGDLVKETRVLRGKEWSRGQEYEAEEQDDEEFDYLMDLDPTTQLQRAQAWGKGNKSLTKGHGKSSGSKGPGKTLSKGKGKGRAQLAIEDKQGEDDDEEEEKPEEEQWKALLSKAKRAKDQAAALKADCNDALEEAEKAKRITKQGKKDTEEILQKLQCQEKVLKQILAKGDQSMSLKKAKDCLIATGSALKAVKDEAKELRQLAHKAASRASKK